MTVGPYQERVDNELTEDVFGYVRAISHKDSC